MNQISQIRKSNDLYQVILDNGTIYNVSELMVLDFDGAQNVAYRNNELNLLVTDITVAASLEAETQAAVLEQLNAAASDVFYLTTADAAALNLPADTYSTIYVGDTADLDKLGGAFSGIAETTGATAAATRGDNAFVLTNRIDSVEQLAATIAHEAGHLEGTIVHDYANDGATLDDFMTGSVFIGAGSSASFANDSFTNLQAANGGAINNSGTVTIDSVVFSSNYAGDKGGAIYNSGITTISGATFYDNKTAGLGAAVFNWSNLSITDCIFSNNSATEGGGAIYNAWQATMTFTKDLTLHSSVDTIINAVGATLTWDITNTSATLNDYSLLQNDGRMQIKVDGNMEQSTYVLATTGASGSLTGKNSFFLTDGSSSQKIVVGGADQTIAGNTFSLDRVGNTLFLTVVSDLAFGQNGASGAASATYKSQPYSGTWDSGQFYTTFTAARDADKKLFIAVNNGETAAISGYVALNGKSMTLSADDNGGTYAGVVMGGERLLASGGTATSTNLTIERGTYNSNVVGGTYVGGSGNSYTMSGTSNLTIHGGTFDKAIAGGMYAYNKTSSTNAANINVGEGNTAVNLTIDGGTFNGRIYGGNYAATDSANDTNTSLLGNVVITIDTKDNAVAINNGMDIGCRGTGTITGSAPLTFKGDGAKLTFGGTDKRVNGACNMAYMEDKGGTQTLVSGISGDRRIVFDAFNGEFGGDVTLFKSLEIKGNSKVNFTGCQDLASKSLLYTIESWTFGDTASEIQGLGESLDFSDDTLTLSSAANQTLFTGSFTGVNSATAWFSSISAGGLTYTLQSEPESEPTTTTATYASGSEKLTLNIGSGKLVVGALA